MDSFDLERFVERSGAVRLDDLDWETAARVGITALEARVLRYMADTETHTLLYMRDLLAGHSARDPEIGTFLSIWVYEECWHGRALDRFLAVTGHAPPPDQFTKVTAGAAFKEVVEAVLSQALAWITPKFAATHMTWGAINELTAAAAYRGLARRTANPVLAVLCERLAKQERRHFAFYYKQAERRLRHDRVAQKLCTAALKAGWDLVGSGVADDTALDEMAAHLFRQPEDRQALREAEETIARLPGLSWFSMIQPAVVKHIRANDRRATAAHGTGGAVRSGG